MQRAYYNENIMSFLRTKDDEIMGQLSKNHSNANLHEFQKNAWLSQIKILKDQLQELDGKVYFEFAIPRMGKRVDNIIIIKDCVFVVEFKVGDDSYSKNAIDQVIDYTNDLKNFHEASHDLKLVAILVSTEAPNIDMSSQDKQDIIDNKMPIKANKNNLKDMIKHFLDSNDIIDIDANKWENSTYKPTPTIIEAARALYGGHSVREISRSDAENLSNTSECIAKIIEHSKSNSQKSICFITGVPGAGKTLAGLNIATSSMNVNKDENAVFLSGNGPLVDVLREALTRDELEKVDGITKKEAAIKANAFIQNIHHFRDDNLQSDKAPTEKVVIFDEAQRAWTKKQASSFMKRKRGIDKFDKSEPDFLIEVLNRHKDWCVIVCLVGGGQEINTGEAGLEEWFNALRDNYNYKNWHIYYSELIVKDKNYLKDNELREWLQKKFTDTKNLHLSVSLRSFRTEKLSDFIHALLELERENAKKLYDDIKENYPILITRNLAKAKKWLKDKAIGTERFGIVASSGARRLRPYGIDVKNKIEPKFWFLNHSQDIRSSYYMEDTATEFDIQGLELDWICVAWGANFYLNQNKWHYQNLKGTKWQNINKEDDKNYLKNSYRVLLTRARQGMVIFIPEGDDLETTNKKYYQETYEYLKELGINDIA